MIFRDSSILADFPFDVFQSLACIPRFASNQHVLLFRRGPRVSRCWIHLKVPGLHGASHSTNNVNSATFSRTVVSRCRWVSKSAQPRDFRDKKREKTTNASSNTIATPWLQRILLLISVDTRSRGKRRRFALCSAVESILGPCSSTMIFFRQTLIVLGGKLVGSSRTESKTLDFILEYMEYLIATGCSLHVSLDTYKIISVDF